LLLTPEYGKASTTSTKYRHIDHILREAIEIDLHPKILNRDDGLCLSKLWKPLLYSLKGDRKLAQLLGHVMGFPKVSFIRAP
jgi:hypothetical protein